MLFVVVCEDGKVICVVFCWMLWWGMVCFVFMFFGMYVFCVVVGMCCYWSWFCVDMCGDLFGDCVELRFDIMSVCLGSTFGFKIVNMSIGCIDVGEGYGIEWWLVDGSWMWVLMFVGIFFVVFMFGFGMSYVKYVVIFVDLFLGCYWFIDYVIG